MIFDFNFKPGPFYRTMGPGNSRELIGAGFMRKHSGCDHTDYEPPIYSLCYVINGSGTYTDDTGAYKLSEGSYFQRLPGKRHTTAINQGQQWLECFIDFGAQLYDCLCKMGMIEPSRPCGSAGADRNIAEAIADFRQSLETCDEESLRLLMPSMLDLHQRILLSGNSLEQSADYALVSHISQLLGENLDCRIDIKTLCRQNGWGYEKMRKLFKASTGVSPAQYRLRRRLDEARRLLLTNRYTPVSEIAAALGYTNVYEFSAQFKKFIGLPPGRFRKGV